MKKYFADNILLFVLSGIVILLDQATKYWVRTHLTMGEVFLPSFWLSQYVRILRWENTGAAGGLFQGYSDVFLVFSLIASLGILAYLPRLPRGDRSLHLAMGLVLGGAIGNLVDRLIQGYVTDFISIGNLPVMNVADISILAGILLLLLDIGLKEQQIKPAQPGQMANTNAEESVSSPEIQDN